MILNKDARNSCDELEGREDNIAADRENKVSW